MNRNGNVYASDSKFRFGMIKNMRVGVGWTVGPEWTGRTSEKSEKSEKKKKKKKKERVESNEIKAEIIADLKRYSYCWYSFQNTCECEVSCFFLLCSAG